ncbi:neuronal acetylcholine receptor subunit alpha-6-like [Pecten maximus]|uniref:neuronal acetylcholine receptor subunit alpha-6-like n=1 Tax=Pecten maximus TaxID=6579 RepID=UPI0014587155|nr:neuronal acetylcholine receptor subunit alpha-6-like [Pecten maximus]
MNKGVSLTPFLSLLVWISLVGTVSGAGTLNVSSSQVRTWYSAVLASYQDDVIPTDDTSNTLVVTIDYSIRAITEFDELAGTLATVGILDISWTSQLTWDPNDYDGVNRFIMNREDVWHPPITLYNAVDSLKVLGHKYNKVTVRYNGQTTWSPPVILKAGCSVNVLNYPFDSQNCSIDIIPWDFHQSEIRLVTTRSDIDTTLYEENLVWNLESTSILSSTIDSKSMVSFKVDLLRRPMWYIIVMIIPVLLLGVLTVFSFYIPVPEGRVGYAMTAFLTFSVFLILIGDNIPKSSDPMSLLSWYVVCEVAFGGLTTMVTIFTVRWHIKDDEIPVPHIVMTFVACLCCKVCQNPNKNLKVHPAKQTLKQKDPHTWINIHGNTFEMKALDQLPQGIKFGAPNQKWKTIEEEEEVDMDFSELCYVPKVSWVTVARTLDHFFFVLFLGGQIALLAIFIVPLVVQYY